MRKKILLAISAMFVLALTVAVFAFNQSNNSSKTAADSCAMKGMHVQAADGQAKTSCCDRDDCCCKNGSCPMKSSGEAASASCCCSGNSCPMKNKESASVDAKNTTAASGENCCNGGACCKSKHS